MHCLEPVGRLAASKGSLSLTVVVSLDDKRTQRGGRGGGEHEHVDKGSGGGTENFCWRGIRRG